MFQNATRGLRLEGTDFTYLTEGAYGIVFHDRNRGRIRKVYRTRWDADVDHCREVFEAETAAYQIASTTSELKDIVPAYFGIRAGLTVVGADGKDVTNEFYRDLAFEAEFVNCSFEKISASSPDEHRRVVALFRKHGIKHVIDASVCLEDGHISKVIDFATKEVELWHKDSV
jgi:hypothetical protein